MCVEYYQSMNNRVALETPGEEILSSVNGQSLVVCGVVSVPVRVGGTRLQPCVRFFVVKGLATPMLVLLGLEFILEHIQATSWSESTFSLKVAPTVNLILFRSSVLVGPQNRVTFGKGRDLPSVSTNPPVVKPVPVVLIRTILVRPRSSCLVNGLVVNPINTNEQLFEPVRLSDEHESLVSPPAMVEVKDGLIPVLMHNPSGKYVRCRAGTIVGHLSAATLIPTHPPKMVIHSSRIGQITAMQGGPSNADDSHKADVKVIHLAEGINIDLSNTIPLTAAQRSRLIEMLQRNIAVFADDPKRTPTSTLAQHRIDTGSHPPVSVPPYRVAPSQRAQIDAQAQEMLENGVIRPSKSPYSSPALLVKKSDGKDRFCVDFRRLNLITKKDVYPLPRIDDMLDALGKADYFSVLDLQSGFWQIPLHPDDMEKTAFSTARGHYEFVVMPFGLCNAPATFQRAMDQLLRDLRAFCQAYMDDVITFTAGSYDLHLDQLEQVLKRLQTAPMVAKPSKFKVLQRELQFLGHIISRHTIKPDPSKTAAVHAFPTPTCVKELQSFMGLVGYYRRFIPQMATIASPLYQLFKKGVPWVWGNKQQSAMVELKQKLTSPPLMRLPDFDRDFVLCTDASGTGIGAVLSQLGDDNVDHPVYYASRTLNPSERHYSASQRECLAVKWACGQFRPYLLGRPFKLYTDHAALRWLFKTKDPKSMFVRWILELQEYDMTILARPGAANGNADALSRLPALLENFENNQAKSHRLISVVTRTKTNSLPPVHRATRGLDTEFVLNGRAYDTAEAIRQSLLHDGTEEVDEDDAVEAKEQPESFDDASLAEKMDEEESDVMDVDIPEMKEDFPPATLPENFKMLSVAQRAAEELLPIIAFLEDSATTHPGVTDLVRTESQQYCLLDHVLYHEWDKTKVKPRLSTSSYRAVIPKSLQAELLRQYHDGVCGAHLGESKTYERIADTFYWSSMYRDVRQYVQSCVKCAARKTSFHHSQTPLLSIPRPTQPFESLGIDVLGPLPTTRQKNKYIVVITDYFTRWPIALPMKNQRASTIATLLVEQVFCQHGFPATLLSDRGSNFLSELMKAVLHVFHVKKLNTTSYHPQTNGLTERFNHTLCVMLSHYVSKNQNDWDEYLPYVLLAYRTTPHRTMKETPFYMLYGRNVRYPFDSLVPAAPLDESDVNWKEDSAEYVDRLIEKLKVAQSVVRERFLHHDEQQQADNEAMNKVMKYAVGDKVWLHNPVVKQGLTRKLTSPWTGPFQVVDCFNNLVNYKVHPLDKLGRLINGAKTRLVHVGRLKKYLDPQSSNIRLTDFSRHGTTSGDGSHFGGG
jgi:hypothetical protein